jgi:ribosomal protein S18 acetylase RimI-like enzyme
VAATDAVIRAARPDDLDDLYRICLLTADEGRDATKVYDDPLMPGHVFAAPYLRFQPDLAFVAADREGVGGYVLGALDSHEFAARLERGWWPALRARYPEPPADSEPGGWTRDQYLAHWMHHPPRVPDELNRAYPSHLHIDLLPRLQGGGLGRHLIETITTAMRAAGSPGLQLHVSPGNERALGFYEHVGFHYVGNDGAVILGMRLSQDVPS